MQEVSQLSKRKRGTGSVSEGTLPNFLENKGEEKYLKDSVTVTYNKGSVSPYGLSFFVWIILKGCQFLKYTE